MRRPTLGALTAPLLMVTPMHDAEGRSNVPPQSSHEQRLGPAASVAVYWVGHSLIESKATADGAQIDLMGLVGTFAKARGLAYQMGDHTLWGSALSALWRGQPHGHKRDAAAMVRKREAFERDAARYDTLVLTELLSIRSAMAYEFSPYYLRRFYCTLKRANSAARVYLYQTWVNLQSAGERGVPPVHRLDWRAAVIAQRADFDTLADQAARRTVTAPGPFGWRLLTRTSDAGCTIEDPIYTVPVGAVLVAIHDRIAKPQPGDRLELADGQRLRIEDLFANPYIDWPASWPLATDDPAVDPGRVIAGLTLRDPTRPHDDIHPSALGIYVNALVHFATLYRQSPVGLPHFSFIGEGLARTLQCIAWETVVADPRSGVAATPAC